LRFLLFSPRRDSIVLAGLGREYTVCEGSNTICEGGVGTPLVLCALASLLPPGADMVRESCRRSHQVDVAMVAGNAVRPARFVLRNRALILYRRVADAYGSGWASGINGPRRRQAVHVLSRVLLFD